MQLSRLAGIAVLLGAALEAAAQCQSLFVDGGRLLARRDSGEQVLAVDPAGIDHPRWSPGGTLIAYARTANDGPLSIAIVRADGTPVRALQVDAESGANAVMELGWLDERRVWIEGHVNPSASIFYVWDVERGKLIEERWGTWFAPSPDGKHLAWLEHVPHGAPYKPRLYIDDKAIYPRKGESGRISHVTWSPDGRRLGFLEASASGGRVVDLDVRSGKAVPGAVVVTSGAGLRWDGKMFQLELGETLRDARRDTRCGPPRP